MPAARIEEAFMIALLVRHGPHPIVKDVLCGRMPGVHLDEGGCIAARETARRMARWTLDEIRTSPLERAQETAEIIAQAFGLKPVVDEALIEIDAGAWTGMRFDDLKDNPDWQAWNECRSKARPPGGESVAEARARMLGALQAAARNHPDGTVAFVSHAEPIRLVLLHAMRRTDDEWNSVEVPPASVSAVLVDGNDMSLARLNEVAA
jgi:probable phosphoglycerate mutase